MMQQGIQSYFDVDDIGQLIEYFISTNQRKPLRYAIATMQQLHPDDPIAQLVVCKGYIAIEQFSQAMQRLARFNESDDEDVLLMRLECLCALKQMQVVHQIVKQHIDQKRPDAETLIEHVACTLNDMHEDGKEEALYYIQWGLSLNPNNIALKAELCFYHEQSENYEQALALCNELIDSDPYQPDYWYMLGRIHALKNDCAKIIESLDYALACDHLPLDAATEIKMMKAFCLYKNDSYLPAIEVYEEILTEKILWSEEATHFLSECYIHCYAFEKAYQLLKDWLLPKKQHYDTQDHDTSSYENLFTCSI